MVLVLTHQSIPARWQTSASRTTCCSHTNVTQRGGLITPSEVAEAEESVIGKDNGFAN
jgi:hypothetical protein